MDKKRPNANIQTEPEEHEHHFGLSLEQALSEGVDTVHYHLWFLLSDTSRRYESALRIPILTTLHSNLLEQKSCRPEVALSIL